MASNSKTYFFQYPFYSHDVDNYLGYITYIDNQLVSIQAIIIFHVLTLIPNWAWNVNGKNPWNWELMDKRCGTQYFIQPVWKKGRQSMEWVSG